MESLCKENRVYWIDNIKFYACILVVLGHFYMSIMASGWIESTNVFYCLPIQTVYTFHVPIFFICSGYLYQVKQRDNNFFRHIISFKNKLLNIGVPYVFFSTITIFLKLIFSEKVNNSAPPLIKTLLIAPIAPYWYLYTLIFLFFIIPTFKSRRKLFFLWVLFLIIKVSFIFLLSSFIEIDIIRKVISNGIWFVSGMLLSECMVKKNKIYIVLSVILLIVGSIVAFYKYSNFNDDVLLQFIVALLFLIPINYLFIVFKNKHNKFISKMSIYFMPVYLLHTILAASFRSLLLHIGISSIFIHIVIGIFVSFIGPIAIYELVKNTVFMFIFEPNTVLRKKFIKDI